MFPLILAGCGYSGANENSTPGVVPPRRSDLPFLTREPDVFQADIVIRVGDRERLISIAREGTKRRVSYDVGTDEQRTVVRTDKEYLIFPGRKTYIERELNAAAPQSELGAYLLNSRPRTEFEEIGRDGTVVQYRARVNEGDASEVLVYYDEAIGLPVKQEFFSTGDESRKLRYSIELRHFKSSVDAGSFEVPAGFRRERDRSVTE